MRLRVSEPGELWLDLHGYEIETALDLVRASLEAAWKRGFERVSIVHGASDVASPAAAASSSRGAIKWGIRGALDDGDYADWVCDRKSGKHELANAASRTSLALLPNPDPDPEAPWPEVPQPEHW